MDDLISRQAAIDACHNYDDGKDAYAYGFVVEERLQGLPSARPDLPDTNVGDMISRQAAIDAICKHGTELERRGVTVLSIANHKQATIDLLESLPSAQPDLDEWCTDCKEYDQERHCCPRWNRVIRNTLKDAQPEPRWIPVGERLPEYGEPVITWDGICYSVEKRIPYIRDKDGEPIHSDWWVSDYYDEEESDYYPNLRDGGCIAWMPLPTAYERSEDE